MLELISVSLSIFSIFILILLAVDLNKNPVFNNKTRIFIFTIYSNMLILGVELISWVVDGLPGNSGYMTNLISNSILYALNLVPLSLWCSYFDECIIVDERSRHFRRRVYVSLNVITLIMVIANLFTGILFQINPSGVFERGPGALISAAFNYIFFMIYLLSIVRYRKLITGRIYQIIICVGIFPIIGGYFQTRYYGVILVWPMMALVCLTAYILIEHQEMNRDAVTLLLTRPQLESRMKFMISRRQAFSIIMLDMDHFKSINDNFGHMAGDEALRTIANLLEKSIMQHDQAYRYAGDEFVILLDCPDSEVVLKIKERLYTNLSRANKQSDKGYSLSFSLGYSFYNGDGNSNINQLLADADDMMYEHKASGHSENHF